jgi:thiol-disulfide isomerase/thioredoxin
MKIFVTMLLLLIMKPVLTQANQVGTIAPDFSLEDLNNKATTLQQFKGKVVFLDFWAPWCDPCRAELPALDALHKRYDKDGLVIIGLDMDPSDKLVKEFLQKVPVAFTILVDKKGAARRSYRIRTLPTAFVIGKDGVIRYVHMGYDKEFLQMYEKEIVELLKQP